MLSDGFNARGGRQRRCYIPRQQLLDAVDRVIGNAIEHVSEIRFGVEDVQARRANEAIHCRRALTARVGADEQEVAATMQICALPAELPVRGCGLRGERAAAMYSLIGSARLNGLDPEAYLHHVIDRIADHPVNRIDELLPWNVAPLLPVSTRVEPIR